VGPSDSPTVGPSYPLAFPPSHCLAVQPSYPFTFLLSHLIPSRLPPFLPSSLPPLLPSHCPTVSPVHRPPSPARTDEAEDDADVLGGGTPPPGTRPRGGRVTTRPGSLEGSAFHSGRPRSVLQNDCRFLLDLHKAWLVGCPLPWRYSSGMANGRARVTGSCSMRRENGGLLGDKE
jgi:hypothetical protein